MIPCNLKSVLVYALTLCLFIFTLAGCSTDFANQHYFIVSEPSSESSEKESPVSAQDWRDINLYSEEEMGIAIGIWEDARYGYDSGDIKISVSDKGETLDKNNTTTSFGQWHDRNDEYSKYLYLPYSNYEVRFYGAEHDGIIREFKLRRYIKGKGGAEERVRFDIPYTKDTVITFNTDMYNPVTTLYVDKDGDGVIDEVLAMDDQYRITHGPEVLPKVRLQIGGEFSVRIEYEGQVLDDKNRETDFGYVENWGDNPALLGYTIQSFVLDPDKGYDVYLKATKKGDLSSCFAQRWDKYLNDQGAWGLCQTIPEKKGAKMFFHLSNDKEKEIVLYVSTKDNKTYDKTYVFEYRQDSFDFQWR